MRYVRSTFRDFESYLIIVVGLNEYDIQMVLKQYISSFVTYESSPGVYTIRDVSEAVYTVGDHEGTFKFEYDDISMETKPFWSHFGSTFGTSRFDDKIFFKFLSIFTPYWDYKPTNAFLRMCILIIKSYV